MLRTHSFDTVLATKIGIIPAIIVGHIAYWVNKNASNKQNYFEGRYWSYNSNEAFRVQFSYLSKEQIRTALKKLKDMGIILIGNFNKNQFDRTLWYSLSDEFMYLAYPIENPEPPKQENNPQNESEKITNADSNDDKSICENQQMEVKKTPNGFGNIDKIQMGNSPTHYRYKYKPNKNTNINTDLNTNKSACEKLQNLPEFLDPILWQEYCQYKKERKEKLTSKGIAMKFEQWAKWNEQGIDVNECIKVAMANEWQGVFKPKNSDKSTNSALSQAGINTMQNMKNLSQKLKAKGIE